MGKFFKKNACSVCDIQFPNKQKYTPACEFMLPNDTTAFLAHVKNLPNLDFITIKAGARRQEVADVVAGFDIETTQISEGDEHYGYMYIWQMVFGDMVVFGRTWEQWLFAMNAIQNRYPDLGYVKTGKKTSVSRQVLFAIANEGYEFQYFSRKTFRGKPIVTNVFADEKRRPITTCLNFGGYPDAFKCIDVLRIGSLSLKSLAKDYCVTQKLVGDLDYDKFRNSKTPLTDEELAYCRNDVVILAEYMRYYIDSYVKQSKIVPITKTGICRAAVAHEFCKRKESVYKLREMFPDNYQDYVKLMTRLYRGGYTHANAYNTNQVIQNVHGMDFTSSYPAVLTNWIECKYPVEKFEPAKVPMNLKDYAKANNKCWYATFEFEGLNATTYHSVESISKIEEFFQNSKNSYKTVVACGITADNGRILHAEKCTVMLTEQDFEVYLKFYTWEHCKISDFHEAEAGKLPEYLTDVIKYFYKTKSELKKQGLSETTAYIVAKQMVNSLYGLCVQSIHIDSIEFDPVRGWLPPTHADAQEAYEEATLKGSHMYDRYGNAREPQYWLPPQFGIWCTAHARRRILTAIYELGNDGIYSDTDSVYFKEFEKHKDWFKAWNARIEAENRKVFGNDFDTCGDLGTFDPVTIDWYEEDGKHKADTYSFKTWGAKRYVKMDDEGHMEQTIAGLPKGTVLKSVQKKHPEMSDREAAFYCFEVFEDGLELELDESQKLTTRYNDTPHESYVTDEFGNTELMHEDSSVCLYKIGFKMTIDDFYKALVKGIMNADYTPSNWKGKKK